MSINVNLHYHKVRAKGKYCEMDSVSDNVQIMCTPPDLQNIAENIKENLLPSKSKHRYEHVYENFIKWKNLNNVLKISENILLAYFSERSEKFKSSTLWSHYSMLKSTLLIRENIHIEKFTHLTTYLKRQSVNYVPKKSKILTREQITEFVKSAPNEQFLMIKVSTC